MSTTISTLSHTFMDVAPAVTIREGEPADDAALRRLAERDSATVPSGPLVVALAGGELRAAVAIDDGATIADPFHRTDELVELARTRATQLRERRQSPLRIVARTAHAGRPAGLHRQAA